VERAWNQGDAARVAALTDTSSVRIGLKPGAPLTMPPTLNAAVFLLEDPMRLVKTQSFRIVRIDVNAKKRRAQATARWRGDWAGRHGVRDLEVVLVGAERGDGWRLTEVRASD
jgi:hypothetical protein